MIVIEHDLKVETTKMNQQHGIRFFKEAHSPGLNFVRQSQVWMDVIQCCMMIGWTYHESSSFILFASNQESLVTKIPKGIFSQLCFYAHFTRALQQKLKAHVISRKCLLQDKSLSLGNLLIALKLVKWFPLQHQPLCTYLKIHANKICNIYDKHMHLQPPFQNFCKQEARGGLRSRVWQCQSAQLIQEISLVSMDLMRCS